MSYSDITSFAYSVLITKHVRLLEAAGLIRRKIEGRAHICQLEPAPLAAANDWLRFYEDLWTEKFDALDALDAAATSHSKEERIHDDQN